MIVDESQTRCTLPLTLKATDEEGTFEGYGAIFGNKDRDGDIVMKGAFAESLKARTPALLWQHNAKEPIGRFDTVMEDAKGLYVKGRLSSTGRGAEARELLKMGALDGLSIGFVTKEAARNATTGVRTIMRADLMEISLVTFPANEMARVTAVKSANQIDDARTFERFLREAGFSRNRAKHITAKGFKMGEERPTATEQESSVDDLVVYLNEKKRLLACNDVEEKGRISAKKLWLLAGLSFSAWEHFDGFTVTGDLAQFFINHKTINPGRIRSRYELQVRYTDHRGRRRTVSLLTAGVNIGPFLIPKGAQQVQVRARSFQISQRLIVSIRYAPFRGNPL